MSAQHPHQGSCQDVRMDPCYQKPPQYAEIHHHRPVPQMPVEINEIGPTIHQGMIQHPAIRYPSYKIKKFNTSREYTTDNECS